MKKLMIATLLLLAANLSFASGEVIKLNTSGTEYCAGSAPIKFTPSTDVDLYMLIEDVNYGSLYTDPYLTNWVGDFYIDSAFIASNKLSFTSLLADDYGYMSVVGTFLLDKYGSISAVKGTALRDGIFNNCYSKSNISGKRVN